MLKTLARTDLLILSTLLTGPALPSVLYWAVQRLNEGELHLTDASFYTNLSRLVLEGYVDQRWITLEGQAPRRHYALSKRGRERLAVERQALDRRLALLART